jgi:predicted transcriptional regulator
VSKIPINIEQEYKIRKALDGGPLNISEIARETGIGENDLLHCLEDLMAENTVKKINNRYSLKRFNPS